ncbi:hypothetical protein K443DRAFT_245231 [Laccaria amethystina LaAM-08-1]|uniref:Unplaced genomic scaffold K443scaffold_159, whole genome shotgun sequence n=1 Tax=Laccaria amethystina LaAM-08-1 TaxID=1095629 RepID=A0A0C9XMY7_9AGAR|nr:hypothetical protein K443DRAFT_245231 [Laccaria amethystina LaAM-08-1]
MQPTLSRFVSTTLPASPSLAINAQTGQFILKQATFSQGANFASVLVPMPPFQIYNQLSSRDKVTWRHSSTL